MSHVTDKSEVPKDFTYWKLVPPWLSFATKNKVCSQACEGLAQERFFNIKPFKTMRRTIYKRCLLPNPSQEKHDRKGTNGQTCATCCSKTSSKFFQGNQKFHQKFTSFFLSAKTCYKMRRMQCRCLQGK